MEGSVGGRSKKHSHKGHHSSHDNRHHSPHDKDRRTLDRRALDRRALHDKHDSTHHIKHDKQSDNQTVEIASEDYFEKVTFEHNVQKDIVKKALAEVEKFILRKKCILVGGMMVDMAMRRKGSSLYPEDKLPDYDFNSPQYHKDAYELAQHLHDMGMPNVRCVSARHPTTMRVYVDFNVVADVTYCPPEIFQDMPILNYKGFHLMHPHYQHIDQLKTLATPYKNPPDENFLTRVKKDLDRYQKLSNLYPIEYEFDGVSSSSAAQTDKTGQTAPVKTVIKLSDIKGQCITGAPALMLLCHMVSRSSDAAKIEFADLLPGYNAYLDKDTLVLQVPLMGSSVTPSTSEKPTLPLFSDDIWAFEADLKDLKTKTYYQSFMEKMPRHAEYSAPSIIYEVYDNKGEKYSAIMINETNRVMVHSGASLGVYFLTKFIHTYYILKDAPKASFYYKCFKLLERLMRLCIQVYGKQRTLLEKSKRDPKSGSDTSGSTLDGTTDGSPDTPIPPELQVPLDIICSLDTYGSLNLSVEEREMKRKTYYDKFNKVTTKTQPSNFYFRNGQDKIGQELYEFDFASSHLYEISGKKCEAFEPDKLFTSELATYAVNNRSG